MRWQEDEMQLQQLRYVLEVENTGSMNKAAKNLFISQPNLSSAINNLEKELNVQIFNRTNKGVEVTRDGKLLIQYAKSILGQVEQLEKAYGIDERKHVSFLEISQTGMINLAHVISKIYNQLNESRVEIIIKEGNIGETIKHLFYMRSEIAIVTMNSTQMNLIQKALDQRKIELNILNKTKLGVVVSPISSLYHRDEVAFEELNRLTYIDHLEEKNLSLNQNGELVDIWSRFLGNTIHVTDREVVLDLLGDLDSYSFNIEKNIHYLNQRGLKFIRLKEDIDIYVGWLKRKREPLSYEAAILVEELIRSF